MKVIQVGPKSIHVASFVKSMSTKIESQFHITEEKSGFEGISKEYLVNFHGLNPISIFKSYKNLKKIIRGIRPDIIHIHQVNRMAFFASKIAASYKIPVVTTAWGSDVLLMPKKNAFYRWLVSSTLKNSDAITGDSQNMLSEMQYLDENTKKYICIQYGIDPVNAVEKEKIIYSNRFLLPLYRIESIVDYFAEFVKQNQEWKLVIASIGDEKSHLENKVTTLGLSEKVEFIGWQENNENRSWYAKSSIYVSIPESDGTSVSVLEALSADCIPVLSDIPVSKEWVEDGINGIIESTNQNPFERALNLDWEEVKKKNTVLIQQNAIRESSIAKFYEIYKQNVK